MYKKAQDTMNNQMTESIKVFSKYLLLLLDILLYQNLSIYITLIKKF